MEYNKEKREILVEREKNKLDKFALDFIKIIEKYAKYVIISGYISILLGRSRATEDIDIFLEKISEEKFFELYEELKKAGFWCLNAEDEKEIFSYLKDGLAVRFSRKGKSIPNFEVKFPKSKIDEEAFEDAITVSLTEGKLRISSLERQIAFKKYYLGADKDIEDALHIEEIFKEKLDYEKINKLKEIIEREKKEGDKV